MRVLPVRTCSAPHWTGLTAPARQLPERLAACGRAVTVLASRHTPALARREMRGGDRPAGRFAGAGAARPPQR